MFLVGENSTDTYRTGRLVDNACDSVYLTFHGVCGAINQLQLDSWYFADFFFDGTSGFSHSQ